MNDLSKLTRQHYEKNEAGASLVSNVTKILDSLPAGSVDLFAACCLGPISRHGSSLRPSS